MKKEKMEYYIYLFYIRPQNLRANFLLILMGNELRPRLIVVAGKMH